MTDIIIHKEKDKNDIKRWLHQPFWDALFTGTATPDTTQKQMESFFGRWRSRAAQITGLQIASIGVFSALQGVHIHCLLAGKNKKGKRFKSLSPVTISQLERIWEDITHKGAHISIAYNDNISDYPAEHLFHNPTQQIVCLHNIRLIKKLKEAA